MDIEIFKKIIENLQMGILLMKLEDESDSKSFRIIYCNPAVDTLSGYKISNHVGQTLYEAFPRVYETTSLPDSYLSVIKNQKALFIGEQEYSDENIEPGIFSIMVNPLDENHVYLVYENITEKKKIEADLLMASINGQEQERERISNDVHDGLMQLIAASRMRFMQLEKLIDKSDKKSNLILNEISPILLKTIKSARNIIKDLMPPNLELNGFQHTIQSLMYDLEKTYNIKTEFHFNVELKIPKVQALNLFRIIQECSNNMIKYSKATLFQVTLEQKVGFISVTISDNGQGFEIDNISLTSGGGFGLANIKNRAKMINASVHIDSIINKGTVIKLKISNRNWKK